MGRSLGCLPQTWSKEITKLPHPSSPKGTKRMIVSRPSPSHWSASNFSATVRRRSGKSASTRSSARMRRSAFFGRKEASRAGIADQRAAPIRASLYYPLSSPARRSFLILLEEHKVGPRHSLREVEVGVCPFYHSIVSGAMASSRPHRQPCRAVPFPHSSYSASFERTHDT